MKLAIMQPYFFPYIGYYQLIGAVDRFILYDNIKYTKKGWINRNRILVGDHDGLFSLALERDSDCKNVDQRRIASGFSRSKLLAQFAGAYRAAPYFKLTFPVIMEIVENPENNLFLFLHDSIVRMCEYLGIRAHIVPSSQIPIDHTLRSQEKVLALCEAMGADCYINPAGGQDLYSREIFASRGTNLEFIRPNSFQYRQFNNGFVPWLSIVDVLMFNSLEAVRFEIESGYTLI